MARTVYRESGEDGFCRLGIASLGVGSEMVRTRELSAGGALVELRAGVLAVNEYVDVALDLGGGVAENLFGHVLEVQGPRAVLRWLFFDPGDEVRLGEVMEVALAGNPRAVRVEGGESPEERFSVEDEARRIAGAGRPLAPPPAASEVSPAARPEMETYEATDAMAAGDRGTARPPTRQTKPTKQPKRSTGTTRKGTVLPATGRSAAAASDDARPSGRNKALTSRLVKPLNLPESDSVDTVPESPDAGRVLTDAFRQRQEQAGQRRESSAPPPAPAAPEAAPPTSTRRVVRPSRGAPPPAPVTEAPTRSSRVHLPTEGSTPQAPPVEPATGMRRVIRPDPAAKPAELPVPTPAPPSSSSTRLVVKPRRMKAKDMPTLARPQDESGDLTPTPAAVDEESAAAATGAPEGPTLPRRPRDAVSQRILAKTRKMQLADLAVRQKTVRVVNLDTIKALIQDAVDEVVGSMSATAVLDEEAVAREVEAKVAERLQSMEGEKRDLQAKARGLEVQLKAAQRSLAEEREREITSTNFTVSEAGLEDLEKHFQHLVQHAIRRNGVGEVLANELERMVSTLLDRERERIAEKALLAHQGKMAMLEKQIERLARSLEETESERDQNLRKLKIMAAQGGGLANIMEAGLDLEDPNAEKKKALLKEIFELNRKLRDEYQALRGKLPESKRAGIRAAAERQAEAAIAELKAEQDGAAAAGDGPAAEAATPADDTVAADPAGLPVEDAAVSDMVDPDDMVWTGPSQTFEQQQESKGQGDVKLMSQYRKFEPPPRERGPRTQT